MSIPDENKLRSQLWRLGGAGEPGIYWMRDASGTPFRFEMNEVQKDLMRHMHWRNIIPKARQHGMTTFIDLFILDTCLWNGDVSAAIIAHRLDSAEEIFGDKVRYPWDQLPEELKAANPLTQERAQQLRWSNGSSIRVTTSSRSGTVQLLHISEYAKIAATNPQKAKEIKTGSLESVHQRGIVFIESTSEGREGEFWELCEQAQQVQESGAELTPFSFKLHFYPWWRHPDYRLSADRLTIVQRMQDYFQRLQDEHGIELSREQKAWYIAKEAYLGDDMKREHPSTLEEAFEAVIEGAYFSRQLSDARREGRITRVPHSPGVAVDTWWDLGVDDATAIWFTQTVGREIHLVDYYEAHGEGLEHYARILDEKRRELGYYYGTHVGPHDLAQRELGTGKTRQETARALGLDMEVAPRVSDKADSIEAARQLLPYCWIDEERCADGIERLRNYRREWDERMGTWKSRPRHDWASHGADAFQVLALAHQWATGRKGGAKPIKKASMKGWT